MRPSNAPLIFASLIFLCSGCVSTDWFLQKSEREYRRTAKSILKAEWEKRRFGSLKAEQVGSDLFPPPPESIKSSTCAENGMEAYTLADGYEGSAINHVQAYYCPGERRYWISYFGGDVTLSSAWYGPFEADIPPRTAPKPVRSRLMTLLFGPEKKVTFT